METLFYKHYSPAEITDYPDNKKDKCIECVDWGDQVDKDIILSGVNEKGKFDYCKSCLVGAIWRLRRDEYLLNKGVLSIIEERVGIKTRWGFNKFSY